MQIDTDDDDGRDDDGHRICVDHDDDDDGRGDDGHRICVDHDDDDADDDHDYDDKLDQVD